MEKGEEVTHRLSLFPLREDERRSWELYCKQEENSWAVSEVHLSDDVKDYEHLSEAERELWDITAAFFVVGDRPVVGQIVTCRDILNDNDLVKHMFLDSQSRIEGVHMHMYGLFVKTIITEPIKRAKLQNAISTYKSVKLKVEAIMKYQKPGTDPRILLLAQVCAEGISFSTAFASALFFKTRGKMKGFCFGNSKVMQDEFIHCSHAYAWLLEFEPLDDETFYDVVRDFVAAEEAFAEEALGDRQLGLLTKESLITYAHLIADVLCANGGKAPLYGVERNPLPYMDITALKALVNFFELSNAEYKHLSVENVAQELKLDTAMRV